MKSAKLVNEKQKSVTRYNKFDDLENNLKELILNKFNSQRELADALGMSEQQLSRSMKRPTVKFLKKLETAMGEKFTIINGKDIQIIQGENNKQSKTMTVPGSNDSKDELIEAYKSIIKEKNQTIEDLREIIVSLKEMQEK